MESLYGEMHHYAVDLSSLVMIIFFVLVIGFIGLLGLIVIILRIKRANALLLRIDDRLGDIEQRIAGGDCAGKEQV